MWRGTEGSSTASVGSDHRINDFPGYEAEGWKAKQEIAKETRSAFKGKVIALYTSAFLELVFAYPLRTSRDRAPLVL